MKNNTTKTIKEIVAKYLEYTERPTLQDIMNLIQPFYSFDEESLVTKELKSKARYIISTFRDKSGIRTYFSDDSGVYINIETSRDLVDLSKVNRQLNRKYAGINAAISKLRKKITKLVKKFKQK